jgi:hypothetical protein
MNVTHLSAVKDVQAEAHVKHQKCALVSLAGLDMTVLYPPVNSYIIAQGMANVLVQILVNVMMAGEDDCAVTLIAALATEVVIALPMAIVLL